MVWFLKCEGYCLVGDFRRKGKEGKGREKKEERKEEREERRADGEDADMTGKVTVK